MKGFSAKCVEKVSASFLVSGLKLAETLCVDQSGPEDFLIVQEKMHQLVRSLY